jgi:hypothetical protein
LHPLTFSFSPHPALERLFISVIINEESLFNSIKRFKHFLSIDETSQTDCLILFANIRISSIGSTKAGEPLLSKI